MSSHRRRVTKDSKRTLSPVGSKNLKNNADSEMMSHKKDQAGAQQPQEVLIKEHQTRPGLKPDPKFLKDRIIPYYFGSYIKDPGKFFGRSEEQARILDYLRQAPHGNYWHIAVVGEYRIGKSSLLIALNYKIPDETNSLSVYLDLSTIREENFFQNILLEVSDKVFSQPKGLGSLGVDADVLRIFKIKADPRQNEHWDLFEKGLLTLIRKLRESGDYSSVVVIIDEISSVLTWKGCSDILKHWRGMTQRLDGYNFLIGSAYPLHQLTKNEWSSFFNIFNIVKLQNMTKNAAQELIIEPAKSVDIEFSDGAIKRIQSLTSNNPYYIQVVCTSICEHLLKTRRTESITDDLVDGCIYSAIDILNEHFISLWKKSTPFQQNILLECARASTGCYNIDPQRLTSEEHNELMPLMERGMIHRTGVGVSTFGLFACWINRIVNGNVAIR